MVDTSGEWHILIPLSAMLIPSFPKNGMDAPAASLYNAAPKPFNAEDAMSDILNELSAIIQRRDKPDPAFIKKHNSTRPPE